MISHVLFTVVLKELEDAICPVCDQQVTTKSYRWVNGKHAHPRCVPKDADVTPMPYKRRELDDPTKDLMQILESNQADSDANTERMTKEGTSFAL